MGAAEERRALFEKERALQPPCPPPRAAESLLRFDDVPTGLMLVAKYVLLLESQIRKLTSSVELRDRVQEEHNYQFNQELRRIADMLHEMPDELHRVIHMPAPSDEPPLVK